jgi:hypothetical protein
LRCIAAAKIASATRAARQQDETGAVKRNNFGAMDTQIHRGERIDAITRTSNHRDQKISVVENWI